MRWLKVLMVSLFLFGCATLSQPPKTQFDCNFPEGREYTCYTDKECSEYFSGYNAVVLNRFDSQKYGWWKDVDVHVVYINLWADHKDFLFLGRLEAERVTDGRIWMRMWLEVYNLECELLHQSYREDFIVQTGEKGCETMEETPGKP